MRHARAAEGHRPRGNLNSARACRHERWIRHPQSRPARAARTTPHGESPARGARRSAIRLDLARTTTTKRRVLDTACYCARLRSVVMSRANPASCMRESRCPFLMPDQPRAETCSTSCGASAAASRRGAHSSSSSRTALEEGSKDLKRSYRAVASDARKVLEELVE